MINDQVCKTDWILIDDWRKITVLFMVAMSVWTNEKEGVTACDR